MVTKNKTLIFLVDEDLQFLCSLSIFLKQSITDIEIRKFDRSEDCLKEIFARPDLVILDSFLIGEDHNYENSILRKISSQSPSTFTIIVSAYEKREMRNKSCHTGSHLYVPKDTAVFDDCLQIIKEITNKKNSEKTFLDRYYKIVTSFLQILLVFWSLLFFAF